MLYITLYSTHQQSAKGWDYHEKLQQHESQTDATKGFGGKFGVQKDRVDKVGVEVGWMHMDVM